MTNLNCQTKEAQKIVSDPSGIFLFANSENTLIGPISARLLPQIQDFGTICAIDHNVLEVIPEQEFPRS
jgi:hypothetical protein